MQALEGREVIFWGGEGLAACKLEPQMPHRNLPDHQALKWRFGLRPLLPLVEVGVSRASGHCSRWSRWESLVPPAITHIGRLVAIPGTP